VNHALIHGPDDDYMLTGWRRPEAIARIFRWAVETDPDATYVINEKWPLSDPANTVAYRRLIEEVTVLGGRIDAIGLMGHLGQCTGRIPGDDVLKRTLDELAPLGLPIHVTEWDLSYDRCYDGEELSLNPNAPFAGFPTWYDYQGWAYRHVMEFLLSRPEVEKIFFWGFYDGLHWRKQGGLFYGPIEGDRHFQPKPAYEGIRRRLRPRDREQPRNSPGQGAGGAEEGAP
jgi:GH35 family endo-1,4-beta-xylanase